MNTVKLVHYIYIYTYIKYGPFLPWLGKVKMVHMNGACRMKYK